MAVVHKHVCVSLYIYTCCILDSFTRGPLLKRKFHNEEVEIKKRGNIRNSWLPVDDVRGRWSGHRES